MALLHQLHARGLILIDPSEAELEAARAKAAGDQQKLCPTVEAATAQAAGELRVLRDQERDPAARAAVAAPGRRLVDAPLCDGAYRVYSARALNVVAPAGHGQAIRRIAQASRDSGRLRQRIGAVPPGRQMRWVIDSCQTARA